MITIQLRRDTEDIWAAKNPVLASGEPGLEKDTGRFKIGDGRTRWNSLDYRSPDSVIAKMIEDAVVNAQIGNPTSNFVMDYEAALSDILIESATKTDTGDFIVDYESDLVLLIQQVVESYFTSVPNFEQAMAEHVSSPEPHPVYDDGPSFDLIYQNAKV